MKCSWYWKGANWKYSNQIKDVILDYLVIIVGYMMQIMSKSDVVVTCKVRNEFWIKLDQVETTNQENVQNLLNLLLLFFLLLSDGPNKPINVQNFANLLFFVFKSPGCWSLAQELIGNWRQSPPIQWSWKILLTTRQSWQWRSSIDDHSPSQNFQCRLPG